MLDKENQPLTLVMLVKSAPERTAIVPLGARHAHFERRLHGEFPQMGDEGSKKRDWALIVSICNFPENQQDSSVR